MSATIQLWQPVAKAPPLKRSTKPRRKKVPALVLGDRAQQFVERFSSTARYGVQSHRQITLAAFRGAGRCLDSGEDVLRSVRRWAEKGGSDWTMHDWGYATVLLRALDADCVGALALADEMVGVK